MLAEVAVVFLCFADLRVLLQKRSSTVDKYPGMWDFGAGKVEENEQPYDAVLRELNEEYGVEPLFGPILIDVRTVNTYNKVYCTSYWLVEVDPDLVKNNEPDKIDEITYVTLLDLYENKEAYEEKLVANSMDFLVNNMQRIHGITAQRMYAQSVVVRPLNSADEE